MNILFWNLKRNPLEKYIYQCLIENEIDIAVFAEHSQVDFHSLEKQFDGEYHYVEGMGGCEKIVLVVTKEISVTIRREQNRYAIYSIRYLDQDFILAGVHLQDRMSSDVNQRIAEIARLKNDVQNLEISSKCKNTIIIGDLNSNPYDPELLQMNAFHAVLFKDVIKRSETRTVDNITYKRLYNPVLLSLSEKGEKYGSFYYTKGSSTPIWNCYDQILVSKPLTDRIVEVNYLKKIGSAPLIRKVAPNSEISDHLPLFVKLS